MEFPSFNWKTVIAVFLLVLGLLLGAQFIYSHLYLEKPLEKLLQQSELVSAVDFKRKQDVLQITVSLKRMQDFYQGYSQINNAVQEKYPKDKFQLEIKDQRNDVLINVWHRSQYVIYEAAANGNFQEMAAAVEKYGEQAGLSTTKIYLDQHAIFLQLEDGANYLYEVVPRNDRTVKVAGGESID